MNREIKVGSRWKIEDYYKPVTVVYVNSERVTYEFEDLRLRSWQIKHFLDIYKPRIEQKPPLKVEAWVYDQDGDVRFAIEGKIGYEGSCGWTREPRLDYEVE